ncbi:hypothetical protein [Carnimonas bestiolae]|uniref:hypothetical protein n=1 Tax=Carnimonas bestiolae TaxID=3402172 RepID=UPI003EDBE6D0
MIGIDNIKDVLIGLSSNAEDWNSDFASNLDDKLAHDFVRLQIELKLLKNSYQKNDLVTAQCALSTTRSMLLSISNFFHDLADDTEELLLSKKESYLKFRKDTTYQNLIDTLFQSLVKS